MGRTFKRNDRWKRDRRDKGFQKSKKFKEIQHGGHHHHSHKPIDAPLLEVEEECDISGIQSDSNQS